MSLLRTLASTTIGVLLLGTGGFGCKPVGPRVFNPEGLAGPRIDPPLAKPDFVLTDTEGRPFNFRKETEGKVALLFFGYTHCPDVCPVHLANIAATLARLSPDVNNAIRVVFVTTDPRRDGPEVIRAYLDRFDQRFIGLFGDSLALRRTMAQLPFGSPVIEPGPDDSTYTVGHSATVIAFTRDNLAHVVYPFGIRQQDWARDLPLLAAQ
jgi:protein SCO1/2